MLNGSKPINQIRIFNVSKITDVITITKSMERSRYCH